MTTVPFHDSESNLIPETTFIYGLKCPIAQQIRYVGKADDPHQRFQSHLRDKRVSHKMRWLQSLRIQDLKPELIILEEVPYERWREAEREWIKQLRVQGCNLTNTAEGGEGGRTLSSEGYAQVAAANKPSPELIEQRASKLRGRKQSPEAVANRVASFRKNAKPYSEQRKEKLRALNTGKKKSPETMAKLQAIADTRKGIKRPPEVGQKVSDARKGKKRKPFSEEWKRNIGNANKGKTHSPESIKKMSDARKRWHDMHKPSSSNGPTLWD